MQIEVFFDYACPYCLRAHEYLKEILYVNNEIKIIWRPCESHPRPDHYGPHSDLCIQGLFFAMDNNIDVWLYHDLMYKAALKDRIDIENIDILSDYVKEILDADAFKNALESGKYENALNEANKYAFTQSNVWAVPSYRLNGKKLDAIEDIGVTKEQLENFIIQ